MADFVILSDDIMSISEEKIPEIKAEQEKVGNAPESKAEEDRSNLASELSEFTLELEEDASETDAAAETQAAAEPSTAITDGIDMATQLSLAETYMAMEDWESAREALEEVVQTGTPEQVAKAKSLLDQCE